jgi:hypothetical protein
LDHFGQIMHRSIILIRSVDHEDHPAREFGPPDGKFDVTRRSMLRSRGEASYRANGLSTNDFVDESCTLGPSGPDTA